MTVPLRRLYKRHELLGGGQGSLNVSGQHSRKEKRKKEEESVEADECEEDCIDGSVLPTSQEGSEDKTLAITADDMCAEELALHV